VGGARTALYNYLFARGLGGTFILRSEDTDAARSTAESVAAIYEGLHWLGLSWDEGPEAGGTHGPYFQSARRDLYRRHAEAMQAADKAYLCYCTAEALEQGRQEQLARGEALSYDGRCRHLDDAARARLVAEGRTAAVRYALPEGAGAVGWEDVVRAASSSRAGAGRFRRAAAATDCRRTALRAWWTITRWRLRT
jgi:glutamyl/glutaminyl-tRNA synthetase